MTLAGTFVAMVLPLASWAMPVPLPLQENPTVESTPALPEATPTPSSSPAKNSTTPKATGKSRATRKPRRPKAATKAPEASPKKVVRNGSTEEPIVQIAPGMSDAQASEHRQGTAQLLATTDANLKKLDAQQLDASKQGVVKQIQTYVEQAHSAEAAGDLDRA